MLRSCCNKFGGGGRGSMVAYWKINFGLRHLVPITDRYADVVCLDIRRQVRGSFLTITISVRFSHISCPFANTGCKRCQIGYVDLTFKQSLYKQINQTEALCRYVLFTEVRVKNGEHFSRRVMENTGIRTTVVMRCAWNWDLSTKIVFILKIYLPFLRLLRWTALHISDPVVPTPPSTARHTSPTAQTSSHDYITVL